MKQYVLDSYALIAFFENEAGAQRVEEILKEMLVGKVKCYLSIVSDFVKSKLPPPLAGGD